MLAHRNKSTIQYNLILMMDASVAASAIAASAYTEIWNTGNSLLVSYFVYNICIQNTHKLKTAPTSNIIYAAPPCLFPQLSSLRRILWIYYVLE